MKRHRFVLRPGRFAWPFRPFPRRPRFYHWFGDQVTLAGQCGICGLDFEAVIHRTGRRR